MTLGCCGTHRKWGSLPTTLSRGCCRDSAWPGVPGKSRHPAGSGRWDVPLFWPEAVCPHHLSHMLLSTHGSHVPPLITTCNQPEVYSGNGSSVSGPPCPVPILACVEGSLGQCQASLGVTEPTMEVTPLGIPSLSHQQLPHSCLLRTSQKYRGLPQIL